MLNSKYDIHDLEINNKEGEKILDSFYNHNDRVVKDKYGLLKSIQAILQFEDYSFGIVFYNGDKHTIVYGARFKKVIYETDIKALLPFKLIDKGSINSSEIMHYNLSCCVDKRSIKRVFIEKGYLEF